ncbi:hypothetical protein D3C80_1721930 [compost metagenome]
MAQGAEGLGRDAHAAIADRLVGCRKITRQLTDIGGSDAAQRAHGVGGERGECTAHLIQAIDRQV